MKNIFLPIVFFALIALTSAWSPSPEAVIAAGQQPEVSMDTKGTIRLVFGRSDSIFCTTSTNGGASFTTPVFVAHINAMHLGMTRGPQIASSSHYSLITAMDKSGNIHFFELNHSVGKWEDKGFVNDIRSSAPEGLMSIAADAHDHFYAVWLDTRHNKRNNICFSSLSGKAGKWTKNSMLYISPDEHVCECCKPSIAVNGDKVAVMYRNWLNGSRDLYLTTSNDGGKTFTEAQKLGVGTWKLNGCPMDGGGIIIDNNGVVRTTWQREGTVYYCTPNQNEVALVKGRSCSLTMDPVNTAKVVVNMQNGGNVEIVNPQDKKESIVGKGSFLKSILLPDGAIFCVWEQDKNIVVRKV